MFSWHLIGHQKITHFLENVLLNDKLEHAYLFYGPKQIGKRTLAKKFIQILMCYHNQKKNGSPVITPLTSPLIKVGMTVPCGQCNHCLQLEKNIHVDVFWLKKEADKKDITIEQIRELRQNLAVHSFFKSYKVAVIEDAEFLNLASANALLKTLEEPTLHTLIILIANQLSPLPQTVLSRLQKIKFLPVATKEIYDYLVSQGVEREQAKHWASLANGRPGRALSFLNNKELWPVYLIHVNNFLALINSSRLNKIKFAEKLLSGKESLVQKVNLLMPMLNLWQLISRDLLLSKLEQNDKIINTGAVEKIVKISQKYSLQKLINLQKYIELTKRHLQLNVNPRLALENLLLSLKH